MQNKSETVINIVAYMFCFSLTIA